MVNININDLCLDELHSLQSSVLDAKKDKIIINNIFCYYFNYIMWR